MSLLIDRRSEGSRWSWLLLGCALALSVVFLTSNLVLAFEPGRYLPVFAAFLMARFGSRAIGPLFVLSLIALFRLTWVFSGSAQGSVGFPTESALLAVFAALAFARPSVSATTQPTAWSRLALWGVLIVLTVAVYIEAVYSFRPGEPVSFTWDVGAWLAAIVLAAAFGLPSLARRLAAREMARGLAMGLVILAAGALLINFELKGEQVFLRFGLSHAEPLLLVLSFVLPAMGAFGWLSLLAILSACYLGGLAGTSISGWELASIAQQQRQVSDVFKISFADRNWVVLIDGSSLVLLGAIIAPFWQQLPIEHLRKARTPLGLALILALQFVGLATSGHSEFHPFVLSGVAFVAGLAWRGRGVVAAPIVIQLCAFLSYTAPNMSFPEDATTDLIRLGMVTFPFAFFGMLSNRYRPEVAA